MRMSDEPSVSVETIISADPEAIYGICGDLEAMASFGTEFQAGEWSSGRPGTVGAIFVGRQRRADSEWESTSRVVAATPGREFAWTVLGDGDEHVVATWRFNLRSVPKGTEVRYGVVLGGAPSGLTAAIDERPEAEAEIIERRLQVFQENMVKVLEGIRRRVGG